MKIRVGKIFSRPLSVAFLFLSLGILTTACSPKGGMRESVDVKETKAFFGFSVDATASGEPRGTVITGDDLPDPDKVAELNLDCVLVCDGRPGSSGFEPVGTRVGECPRFTGSAHWSCRACPPIPGLFEDACSGFALENCKPWVIPAACSVLSY